MSAAISPLQRVALATQERYWWINAIAVALSLVIAVMSLRAYGELGQWDKAAICIVCQMLAIAMAVLARRAWTADMPLSALLVAAGAIGCAWWASHGLALAWAAGGDPVNAWMVWFLAALEPALFLFAEHIREGREALRSAHERAESETQEAMKIARERDERNERLKWATVSGMSALMGAQPAHASEPALTVSERAAHVSERPPIASTNVGYADRREHVRALVLQGKRPMEIHRETHVPVSTVSRWARQDRERAA